MASDDARLLVRLEVSQRKMEKQLARLEGRAITSATNIDKRFTRMNRTVSRGFEDLSRSGSRAMLRLGTAVSAVTAGLGAATVRRYADAWTAAGNKLRAASQISGRQARSLSELNDIATANRAGLEETVDLYAKVLRATDALGASEAEAAKATQIVTQAFKAGGAAASEQAAGILQLGQALSSGVLQGDELRSLRENAPIITQAIADEFETTIGGLKELGAEGALTSDRVFRAIINAQEGIAAAFAQTRPTIADGFTAFTNGMTEFVAAMDQGSGASAGLTDRLSAIGGALSDGSGSAERFGARLAEVLTIVRESADGVREKLAGMTGGLSLDDVSSFVSDYIDLVQGMVASIAGAAAAIKVSFLNAVGAVANGAATIANAAISGIEALINGVVTAISTLVAKVNAMSETIAGSKVGGALGLSLPTLKAPGSVTIDRVPRSSLGGGDAGLAFEEARFRANKALGANRREFGAVVRRVENAGRTPYDPLDPRGDQVRRPASPSTPTPVTVESIKPRAASGAGSSAGGARARGAGGAGGDAAKTGLFDALTQDKADLETKIAAIGLTSQKVAELTARRELLNEAERRGLDLDQRHAGSSVTLRQEIDQQAASLGRLTAKYESAEEKARFYDDVQGQLKDGFLDAIVAGEGFAGVLGNVAQMLAKALLQASLFGEGPLGGGAGGLLSGLFGGLLGGGAPSFAGGGHTGHGPRSGGLDGRGGFPAILHPNETVIDHSRGGRAAGGTVRILIEEGPQFASRVRTVADGVAVERAGQAVEASNGEIGTTLRRHRQRPNRRGG